MTFNHYDTLEVSQQATPSEIKQAYRRLVKQFHPDSHQETANHDKTILLNAAYEVLSDPQRRRSYDRQLSAQSYPTSTRRQERAARAQDRYQRTRQSGRQEDANQERWLKQVYGPVSRLVSRILKPIDAQIDYLSADPFDEQLLEAFQGYLSKCRERLDEARQILASQPNPAKLAGVAAHLYYCLNQLGDGIDELEWFTLNYDDRYLHTGKELFRIAASLLYEARDTAKASI